MIVPEESVLSLPAKVLECLQTNDAADVVDEFKSSLKIDDASLRQPDASTMGWLRCLFKTAVRKKKLDLVRHLRQITPAGTTGIFYFADYNKKHRTPNRTPISHILDAEMLPLLCISITPLVVPFSLKG